MTDSGSSPFAPTRWIVHGALMAYAITVGLLFSLSTCSWGEGRDANAAADTLQSNATELTVTIEANTVPALQLDGASDMVFSRLGHQTAVLRDREDFERIAGLEIGSRMHLALDDTPAFDVHLIDWPVRYGGALLLTLLVDAGDETHSFLLQVNRRADLTLPPLAALPSDFYPPVD